jgi:secreted trypsin-like serine protease
MRNAVGTAVVATVVALCLLPGSASAIVAGELDGDAHPNVGFLALEDAFGPFFCSGTLVAPTVVLTAGHCVAGVTDAQVSFDSVAPPPPGEPGSEGHFIPGTPHAHPGFGMRNGHGFNDIGVVVLDAPATSVWPGIQPVPLPVAGSLTAGWADGSLKRATITLVGYGAHENHGTVATFEPVARRRTDVTVASLAPEIIKFHAASRNKRGGGSACFGDSGGPALLGGVVVAVTNGGPPTCNGFNVYQRADTASARGFLDDFVALP